MPEYRLSAQLQGHEDDVCGICVCGDAGIATSSRDRTVKFWTRHQERNREYVLSKTLVGHSSFVGPLAWIPPLDRFPEGAIVSGGMDTLVLIWDLCKGEVAETLKGHASQVTGLAVDSNGDIISSSMDCTVRRWRNGKAIEVWEAHKVAVQTVLKLPTGELFTGSSDSTIKLWKGRTCLQTFSGHADTVRCLASMPGLGILSASHDSTIKLWELTGQPLLDLIGHTSLVYSVDAHSSGQIASGSEDRSLKIWKDGACVQSIDHPGCIWGVKFLENGDVVTACSDGTARIWTTDSSRFCGDEEIAAYTDLISQYALSRKTVGRLKLMDLPGSGDAAQVQVLDSVRYDFSSAQCETDVCARSSLADEALLASQLEGAQRASIEKAYNAALREAEKNHTGRRAKPTANWPKEVTEAFKIICMTTCKTKKVRFKRGDGNWANDPLVHEMALELFARTQRAYSDQQLHNKWKNLKLDNMLKLDIEGPNLPPPASSPPPQQLGFTATANELYAAREKNGVYIPREQYLADEAEKEINRKKGGENLDLQLLPGEPPTWEEELEEKENRAEMAIVNEEIIEALMVSEILWKEEQNALQESKEIYEELQNQNSSLRNALQKLEAEKRDILKALGDEKEAKIAVESSRNEILKDLKKARLEEKRLNDQVEMLQNTNKRLQDYNASWQQCCSNLQSKATKNNEAIAKLQKEKNTMVETMNGLKDHIDFVKNQFDLTKASHTEAVKQKNDLLKEVDGLRSELQRVREDCDSKSAQVDSLMSDLGTYKELTRKSVAELDNAITKYEVCQVTIKSQREMIRTLEIKLSAATEKLKMCDLTAMEAMAEHEKQKKMLADLQLRLDEAKQQNKDGENLRKKLHNTILELKGNIRVFCRVRRLQPNESGAVTYPKGVENMGRGIELNHNAQAYSFAFDKVFDHSTSQKDVFIEISQLVQSALDGYKVCIFAYGQTGSGKTYTMMGNPEVEDQKGMIPRSLEQIFRTSQTLNSQGWKYKMQASMLEIYNETIRDLLSTNRMATQEGGSSKYNIKHDANGNTHVSDLTVVDVTSINEVSSLLRRAAQSRSIGRTQMNEESSRSHCVFTLRISGVNEGTDQQVQGVLNLIDLAGSERLSKSGATGDRLKETLAINKSLSSLGDVIFSIAKKDKHVPYRNSKLTYLLQPCLGGDSKTLMFVNLSPESSSAGESLCSLRFAARVNSCEIGIPRRQTQMRNSQ